MAAIILYNAVNYEYYNCYTNCNCDSNEYMSTYTYTGCSLTHGTNFHSSYKSPKITLFQE